MSTQLDVQQLILSLPTRVQLPESADQFFAKNGPVATHFDEQRRFPRFYCRTEAALCCQQSLPSCARQQKTYRIYVKDISRSSVAFYHFEQLFPCEALEVIFADGETRPITITRCRKIQNDCYEVVGHFSGPQSA